MTEKISGKQFFKDWGLFLSIITVLLGLALYSVIIARKSWTENLRTSVEKVLEETQSNQWTVLSSIPIENPFTTNAAAYEVRNRNSGEICTAVIIRLQTYCGPIPGIYLCDSEGEVSFIGYSSLHGRIKKQLEASRADAKIEYWRKKIPYILN